MKTTPKIGKVTGINLVDETSELMVISQFGEIIRIDTKSNRADGLSTQGVKLLYPRTQGQSRRHCSHPQKKPNPA
jgi:DNA gyrase subunit A